MLKRGNYTLLFASILLLVVAAPIIALDGGLTNNAKYFKQFVFIVGASISVILISIEFFLGNWMNQAKSSYDKYILGAILINLLYCILISTSTTFAKNPSEAIYYLSLLLMIFIGICCSSDFSINVSTLFAIITFVLITEGVYAVLQFAGLLQSMNPNLELTGTFSNSGPLSIFMASGLPFCFFLIEQDKKWLRFLGYFGSLFVILVVALSFSRTAILACSVIGALHFRTVLQRKLKRRIAITSLLAVVLLCCLPLFFFKIPSIKGRFLVWEISALMIKNSPIFGYGMEGFEDNYYCTLLKYNKSLPAANVNTELDILVDHPFNEFINMIIERGIVGLILFISLVGIIVFTARNDSPNRTVKLCIVSLLLSSFTSYPFQVPGLWGLFVFSLLFLLLRRDIKPSVSVSHSVFLSIHLIGICFVAYVFMSHVSVFSHERVFFQAERAFKEGRSQNAKSLIQPLISKLDFDHRVEVTYGKVLSSLGYFRESNETLTTSKGRCDPFVQITMARNFQELLLIDSAESCLKNSALVAPHILYPKYLLANLYYDSHQYCKAYFLANDVLTSKPRVTSHAVDEMKLRMLEISVLTSDFIKDNFCDTIK